MGMSFNILAPIWTGNNGRIVRKFDNMPTENFAPGTRRRQILKTIRDANPDILMLQEAQVSELSYLTHALDDYILGTRGFHGKDTGGDELWAKWIPSDCIHKWEPNGNPIFVRSSLASAVNLQGYTIPLTKDGCNAGAVIITLRGKRIAVANVHMSHPTDEPLTAGVPNNVAQWESIQRFKREQEVDYTIIGGDFNVNTQHAFYKKLTSQGWVDNGKTFGVLDGTCTPLKYGKERHTERIDYILSDKSEEFKCTAFKAPIPMPESKENQILDALKGCGSDHLPLQATFGLTSAA